MQALNEYGTLVAVVVKHVRDAFVDEQTVAVGRGYRTNAEGIRQLRTLVGESVDIVEVPLPHWRGPSDIRCITSLGPRQ